MSDLSLARFKRCTKCGCTKPATPAFFTRQRKGKYGFTSRCKTCRLYIGKVYREANTEAIAEYNRLYREQNLEHQRAKGRAYNKSQAGRESARRYREKNREKLAEYNKQYYEKHREKMSAINRQWYEANRESELERLRRDYQENRERYDERSKLWRRDNPEKANEIARRWKSKNPDAVKRYNKTKKAKRRAAILASGEHFTQADLLEMYESQGGRCAYCECELNGDYHPDHMQPLSRGGSNGPENIAITCPPCNISKHAKTVEEFFNQT